MAKFSEVITLREITHDISDTGAVNEVVNDTDVFFNRYTIRLENRLQGAADGLHGLVTGQVRSADYNGQQAAVLDSQVYTVEDVQNSGEFATLTLTQRLSDEH